MQDIMEEPAVAADGQRYDRYYISKWMETHNTSPLTNQDLEHRSLSRDVVLVKELREWKRLHSTASQQAANLETS